MSEPSLFTHPIATEIISEYKSIWALNHLILLASWDLETYMPVAGAPQRGMALAKTKTLVQKLFLDDTLRQLIHRLAKEEDLNVYERGLSRVLTKELEIFEKLPAELIEEIEHTVNQAQVAWREARQNNDFKIFQPFLAKIIDLNLRKAELLGFSGEPYDALLDLYEEGSTAKQVTDYFAQIKPFLMELLAYIQKSPKYNQLSKYTELPYDQQRMEQVNKKLLHKLGYDPAHMRLDISSHPFAEGLSTGDVRITTRYEKFDFARTMTSVMHEFGHGLYFMQSHPELEYSPLYGGSSLGLHESQSRFWENKIGRSKEFMSTIKDLMEELGGDYVNLNIDDLYLYFNSVRPSFIRVEADEVTYHFHIMIRYELERALLNRELQANDLPTAWNDLYQKYLGIRPTTDSEGVLQDIHWSMGAIGYFPTYSTGTILSSQISKTLESQLGPINSLINSTDGVKKIHTWLYENMHKYGSTYSFNGFCEEILKEKFTPKYWMDYLSEKYRSLY